MGRISSRECSGTFEDVQECSTNLDEGSKLDFLIQNHNLSKMTILIGYFLTPLLTLNRPFFLPNRYQFLPEMELLYESLKTCLF